jgi:hypothetical protein
VRLSYLHFIHLTTCLFYAYASTAGHRALRAPPFAFTRSATVFRASESYQSSCAQLFAFPDECSTQVHYSCLPAPSSALSSPFNTLPALQHVPTFMPYLPPAPRRTLSLPSTATFHLLVSLNVLTTATLLRLPGFFQSFTGNTRLQQLTWKSQCSFPSLLSVSRYMHPLSPLSEDVLPLHYTSPVLATTTPDSI